jgi:pimeloyl-ACP methyl ester carboxylesterase
VISAGPQYTDRAVRIRGLNVYTRRRPGSASPPLLFINGLGGSLTSWSPLLHQLPHRDVLMIDTPGAGRSQTPPLPLRVTVLADIVAEAARVLGVEQVDVLGFSLGGTVAQEFARRHAGMARRLILVGTMHGLGARPVPLKASRLLLSTKRYRDIETARRDMPRLAGGRTARDPDMLAALASARESYPPSVRGYYYQQLALIGWSSWFWLKRLDIPTLVLHGGADPVVPMVNARLLASRIPDAQLEIIGGAGHLLLFDESEKVAPIIEGFLDR